MKRNKPKPEPTRFKIDTGLKVYYVYATDAATASRVFGEKYPNLAFTCKPDTDEWKTALQDGRVAPGA